MCIYLKLYKIAITYSSGIVYPSRSYYVFTGFQWRPFHLLENWHNNFYTEKIHNRHLTFLLIFLVGTLLDKFSWVSSITQGLFFHSVFLYNSFSFYKKTSKHALKDLIVWCTNIIMFSLYKARGITFHHATTKKIKMVVLFMSKLNIFEECYKFCPSFGMF